MSKCATRIAYGKALAQLVQEDERIVVFDADLAGSTKTIEAKKVCPDRHFDMGIAEANMMDVAAGFAASGKIAFASSFAMFASGRVYEQIRNTIGYTHLNVKICASHAGLSVGEDGASHQCIEDITLMRTIPGMTIVQPCDAAETLQAIRAVAKVDGPCYVRLGRSEVEDVFDETYVFTLGKGVTLRKGSKVAILATGLMVQETLKACDLLDFQPTVINIHTIKPIDEELIIETAKTHDVIITAEEHTVVGGLGSAVCDVLADKGFGCRIFKIGVQDKYGESGKPKELLRKYEIDAQAIADKIKEVL